MAGKNKKTKDGSRFIDPTNIWLGFEEVIQLVAALNDSAFQIETVAHLRGLERELLPKAELNRKLAKNLKKYASLK